MPKHPTKPPRRRDHVRLAAAFDRAREFYNRCTRSIAVRDWPALSFPERCAWVNAADELEKRGAR